MIRALPKIGGLAKEGELVSVSVNSGSQVPRETSVSSPSGVKRPAVNVPVRV